MNITGLLLLLGSTTISKKLQELFQFKIIVQGEEILENPNNIFIDYSYAPYCNSLNYSAEAIPINNTKKGVEINAEDWIVFTRGSSAGRANKISELIFNRHHLVDLSSFKIFCSTNVIIFKEKDDSTLLAKGYADLLLSAVFDANRIDFLIQKDDPKIFTLNLNSLKEFQVNIPELSVQKKFVKDWDKIMNSRKSNEDFKSYVKLINEKLQELFLNVLNPTQNEEN
jgi:hypothetical protein